MADELHRRYGLDVRETDPSVLGEQGQIPAHATLSVDELVVYDQRVHEQLERLAEQRAQLAGADPSLDSGAEQHLAQLHEQTVELTEIRDLIAEDLADRRQYEPEAPRGQDVRERQERRELADAELRTGAAAAGIPPAVEASTWPPSPTTRTSAAPSYVSDWRTPASLTRRSTLASSPTPVRACPPLRLSPAADRAPGPGPPDATRRVAPQRSSDVADALGTPTA
jgi:hypothetical protein